MKKGIIIGAGIWVAPNGLKVYQELGIAQEIVNAGQTCWRFVSTFDFGEELNDQMFEVWSNKKGLRVGYSKIDRERVYCFITNYQEAGGKDGVDVKEKLLTLCSEFQPMVKELISSSETSAIIRSDLYDFKPIDRWTDGRVVLMGDAAHATTPNMGQGACQAIEDALVLATELSINAPQQAFRNFHQKRKDKTAFITNNSWRLGQVTNTQGVVKKFIKFMMKYVPKGINTKQIDRVYGIN